MRRVVLAVAVAVVAGAFPARATLYSPDDPMVVPVRPDGTAEPFPFDEFRRRFAQLSNVADPRPGPDGKPNPDRAKVLARVADRPPAKTADEDAAACADLVRLAEIPSIAFPGYPRSEVIRAHDLVVALLREAGCTRSGSEMRLPGGEPLTLEFLDDDPVFQPVTQPFIRNLALVGIRASSRMVDPSQYQARLKDFDFDLTARRYSGGVTPGAELRDLYGSRAAGTPGSLPAPSRISTMRSSSRGR